MTTLEAVKEAKIKPPIETTQSKMEKKFSFFFSNFSFFSFNLSLFFF